MKRLTYHRDLSQASQISAQKRNTKIVNKILLISFIIKINSNKKKSKEEKIKVEDD